MDGARSLLLQYLATENDIFLTAVHNKVQLNQPNSDRALFIFS